MIEIRYAELGDPLLGNYVRVRPGSISSLEYNQFARVNTYSTGRAGYGVARGPLLAFELIPGLEPDFDHLGVDEPTLAMLNMRKQEILKGHVID